MVGGGGGAGVTCDCARVVAIDSIMASSRDSLSIPLGFPASSRSPVTDPAFPEFIEGKASDTVDACNRGGSAGRTSSVALKNGGGIRLIVSTVVSVGMEGVGREV